jgi:hypothetical protein
MPTKPPKIAPPGRLVLVKGKSIQEIARDLKVSWRQPSVP